MGIFINPFAYTLGGGQGVGAGGAGPDDTQNYVEVTIAASQVSSTLTDFPVYVDLSDLPAAFFTGVQSDGGDIRVTESDGTTRAPVDLVSIDTGASTGELHFLASSLSATTDTVYRIYYNAGTTQSQPLVTGTYGRNAVWADYGGVWHGDDLVDSTGSHNLTARNGASSGLPGKIGDSFGLVESGTSTSDYFDAGEGGGDFDPVANQAFTVQMWAEADVSATAMLIDKDYANGGATLSEGWGLIRVSDDTTVFQVRAASTNYPVQSTGTVAANVWGMHTGVREVDGTLKIYVDGALDESAAGTTASLAGSNDVYIGVRELDASPTSLGFDGEMDEIRFRLSGLSAAHIAAEYTNQHTPTTFYSVGSQQAA